MKSAKQKMLMELAMHAAVSKPSLVKMLDLNALYKTMTAAGMEQKEMEAILARVAAAQAPATDDCLPWLMESNR